jgi:hypothetical protein
LNRSAALISLVNPWSKLAVLAVESFDREPSAPILSSNPVSVTPWLARLELLLVPISCELCLDSIYACQGSGLDCISTASVLYYMSTASVLDSTSIPLSNILSCLTRLSLSCSAVYTRCNTAICTASYVSALYILYSTSPSLHCTRSTCLSNS